MSTNRAATNEATKAGASFPESRRVGTQGRERDQRSSKFKVQSSKTARRVAVVTGSRSEYGLLRSTIRAVAAHPRLELRIIATGTHLLPKFGSTYREIVRDGWKIDAKVPMQRGDDGPLDQAEGLSRGVAGIAQQLQRLGADIVLVLGDRLEAMAGALAGVTTGRIVAHIHGGDVAPGDFDDSLRHAITKLAHVHLAATESAARRILQMGEPSTRVHVVGAPGLDRVRELRSSEFEVRSSKKTTLIVQHPCGRSAAVERRTMGNILRAVGAGGLDAVCIYPNSDRGHGGIVAAIKAHRKHVAPGRFRVFRSLDQDSFLRRLMSADLLLGNSSSGMIEAASAGTPAVNVGDRQRGRECDARFVVQAKETEPSIRAAIREALALRPVMGQSGIYGDGRSGRRIAALLARVPLTDALRRKIFADLSHA